MEWKEGQGRVMEGSDVESDGVLGGGFEGGVGSGSGVGVESPNGALFAFILLLDGRVLAVGSRSMPGAGLAVEAVHGVSDW